MQKRELNDLPRKLDTLESRQKELYEAMSDPLFYKKDKGEIAKAKKKLAENMRERRLAMSLTQAGLSKRSGVALPTLRKFEQSGAISIDNLFKLMLVVGGLNEVVDASAPNQTEFASIDDVLSGRTKSIRKRGTKS